MVYKSLSSSQMQAQRLGGDGIYDKENDKSNSY